MKRLIIAVIFVLAYLQAQAWGGYEHTIIAYAAQDHLTENAARHIRFYLDQPIYEYSEWMDFKPVVRHPGFDIPRTGHSTAVGNDGTIPEVTPFDNGKGKGSCYMHLKEIMKTMMNHRAMPDSLVVFHLRCFIHMMGDFHCPVHINFFDFPKDGSSMPGSLYGSGVGFSKIYYEGKSTSLHSVWDSPLKNIAPDLTFEEWRQKLDTWNELQRADAVRGDLRDWLVGNCQASREVYDGCVEGMCIDCTYFTGRMEEIAYQQIRLAIYRMAKVLNDCFDYED